MVLAFIPSIPYTYLMAELPVELITRLNEEALGSLSSLAHDDSSASTASMRSYANLKLNALVPKSLTTLTTLLDDSDPKIKLATASKILDAAPATRPLDPRLDVGLTTLPESAITALVAGLAAFGRGLGLGLVQGQGQPEGRQSPSPQSPGANEATDVIVEVIPDKPKRQSTTKEKPHDPTKH